MVVFPKQHFIRQYQNIIESLFSVFWPKVLTFTWISAALIHSTKYSLIQQFISRPFKSSQKVNYFDNAKSINFLRIIFHIITDSYILLRFPLKLE